MIKRYALLCLMFLLLLVGCGQSQEAEEIPQDGYLLYFPQAQWEGYGDALGREVYTKAYEGAPKAEGLLIALLMGPTDEALASPFPQGTSMWWIEEREGILTVNLSEEYSELTGISLTLADYCITLTLSQLEGIDGVRILSAGQSNSYRDHQILQAKDVAQLILNPEDDT